MKGNTTYLYMYVSNTLTLGQGRGNPDSAQFVTKFDMCEIFAKCIQGLWVNHTDMLYYVYLNFDCNVMGK